MSRMLAELLTERQRARLQKLILKDENGCWLFTGYLTPKGYGSMKIGPVKPMVQVKVHRLTYELKHGAIPVDLQIDHLCRVRNCVNPDHLEAVTLIENIRRSTAAGAYANRRRRQLAHKHGDGQPRESVAGANGSGTVCEGGDVLEGDVYRQID